jgi:hypothetical protein
MSRAQWNRITVHLREGEPRYFERVDSFDLSPKNGPFIWLGIEKESGARQCYIYIPHDTIAEIEVYKEADL